jgi:hypothetical protein
MNQISTASELPPVYLLVTYWGKPFAEFLCKFTFPSLLAPGNIPALERRDRCKFLICSPAADWHEIQRQPSFQLLRDHIEVVFVQNEEAHAGEHKYVRMSRGHALLTQKCFEDGAIAININPDSVYPDGSIAEAQRLAKAGAYVVLCTAIRFEMEGVEMELAARGLLKPAQPFALPKRQAVEIGLRHLHSESRASNWTARNFGRLNPAHGRRHFLTCCFWEVPGEDGVIIITHNWAPFMINYTKLKQHDVSTLDGRALDGNYIFENFSDAGIGTHIHVVEDSDSLFMLGLTPRAEMAPPNDYKWWRNWPIIGHWTRGYILNRTVFDPGIDSLRRKIYLIPVRWHSRDITPRWRPIEAQVIHLLKRYVSVDVEREPQGAPSLLAERSWRRIVRPLVKWR